MNIRLNKEIINLNKNKKIKIIVISDIHNDALNKRKEEYKTIIKYIYKLQPNYILIPGDIIQSEKANIKNVNFLIKELGKICKVILTLGNHELKAEAEGLDLSWYFNLNKLTNVYALNNENKIIDKISFISINPDLSFYDKKERKNINKKLITFINNINININKELINIALCHNPEFLDQEIIKNTYLKNTDLIVCGHMHNGCTPMFLEKIFKDKGLVGPYYTLFPKKCRGIQCIENTKVFVSKGLRKITIESKLMNKIDKLFYNDIHEIIIK